jgi:hypothetical protein
MIARAKAKKPDGPVEIVADPQRPTSHFNIRLKFQSTRWEQWLLLTSDHHWDNPKCRRDLLERDLNECRARKGLALSFGDTFCAMQGPHDKRMAKGDTRSEHDTPAYYDDLVNTGAEWYGQWKDLWLLMTSGNHETSVLKHSSTSLIDRLAAALRQQGGFCRAGSYRGWANFQFDGLNDKNARVIHWHHGFGGGGPVTKGLIDNHRMQTYVRGADIYCMGHVHYQNLDINEVEEYRAGQGPVKKREYFVRCSSYKDEFGSDGYHIEKGRGPRPLGGWWCRLYSKAGRNGVGIELTPTEMD